MTCIGWRDSNGCPHYGGEYHGCAKNDKHRGNSHTCACGTRMRGTGDKPGRPVKQYDGGHGTDAGYRKHMRDKTPTCAECRAAHTQAEIDRLKRRGAA